MKNSIKLSWELTNPIIGELLLSEKKLFDKIALSLNDFGDVSNTLEKAMINAFNVEDPEVFENANAIYDPKNFIRSQTLMKRNDDTNYEHIFNRYTNTFGNTPQDRLAKFLQIKDGYPYN